MTFKRYRYLVMADLYRLTGDCKAASFLKHLFLGAGFAFMFWWRTHQFVRSRRFLRCMSPVLALIQWRFTVRTGIEIGKGAEIGPGLCMGHIGSIVVNDRVRIGRNCNIGPGAVIGQANRGARKGCPVIGDNVFIGPGAKLFGRIVIGNNAAIGANSVVTRDVPEESVVVGAPAKVISCEGSADYINRTDYDAMISDGAGAP